MNEAINKDAIRLRIMALAFAATVSSSACSAPPESITDRTKHPDKPITRVEQPADSQGVATGEVPAPVMQRVRAQLSQDSTAADTAQLVRSEQVIFNDGSLGCPEPGAFYTMATVPGYHVVYVIAGETFDYRVNMQGTVKRCLSRSSADATTPSR